MCYDWVAILASLAALEANVSKAIAAADRSAGLCTLTGEVK